MQFKWLNKQAFDLPLKSPLEQLCAQHKMSDSCVSESGRGAETTPGHTPSLRDGETPLPEGSVPSRPSAPEPQHKAVSFRGPTRVPSPLPQRGDSDDDVRAQWAFPTCQVLA